MKINIENQNISIILLAGGKSIRMGKDKGLIKLNGQTLLEQVLSKVEKISRNILIMSNQAGYDQFKYPVFRDIHPDKGPIGGIYTGLTHSTTENNLVIGCDMPNLSLAFLNFILQCHKTNFEATIPIQQERIQPLAGVYKKSCSIKLKTQIDAGIYKMIEALKVIGSNYIEITKDMAFYSPYLFDNLNTIEDLTKHEQLLMKWR